MEHQKRCGRLWSGVGRWVAPTSDEIVQDILSFPHILDILIENNGCVVLVLQHSTHTLSLYLNLEQSSVTNSGDSIVLRSERES